MNHSEIVSFIWGVADLIRDTFKRGKYQDVILPLTVLRRLDCVLEPTKEAVLARQAELKEMGLENLDQQLSRASGFAFYNTSRYDFDKLLGDAPHLAPSASPCRIATSTACTISSRPRLQYGRSGTRPRSIPILL